MKSLLPFLQMAEAHPFRCREIPPQPGHVAQLTQDLWEDGHFVPSSGRGYPKTEEEEREIEEKKARRKKRKVKRQNKKRGRQRK